MADLREKNLLTFRLYAMIWETGDDFKALSTTGPLLSDGHDFLTVRSVKLLADGAGQWADFVLVDQDLFKRAPAEIWTIKVDEIRVAGKRVH